MKLKTVAPILFTATLLSACGGGSDSPAATDTPVPSAATRRSVAWPPRVP